MRPHDEAEKVSSECWKCLICRDKTKTQPDWVPEKVGKMKKLMITAAAALCATLAVNAEGVESGIVGSQTIDAPAAGQSVALAIQFSPVDGASTVSITNLLTVATPKASPTFGVTGDQLWKYDPSTGWVKYWWRTASKNWVKNGTTAITEDTVAPGDTVLFRRGNGASATTISLSGAIRPFEATPVYSDITAGTSRFIGYPWPVAFDAITLPLYQTVGPKGSPTFGVTGDQIWTYDSVTGWKKYWYRTASKTYRLNGSSSDATSIPIAVGEGFFFRRGNGGAAETITFTYPAKTAE